MSIPCTGMRGGDWNVRGQGALGEVVFLRRSPSELSPVLSYPLPTPVPVSVRPLFVSEGEVCSCLFTINKSRSIVLHPNYL